MNDKDDHKREICSWQAALIGAAAGALAVALANRETREKIRGKVNEILGKGREKREWAREKIKDLESQARQRAAEELEKARNKIKEEGK